MGVEGACSWKENWHFLIERSFSCKEKWDFFSQGYARAQAEARGRGMGNSEVSGKDFEHKGLFQLRQRGELLFVESERGFGF
jgi:hypothetical protein